MGNLFTKSVRSRSNARQRLAKLVATLLARMLHPRVEKPDFVDRSLPLARAMSLHGPAGGRKYLNAKERRCFILAARTMPPKVRIFCLVLAWSGCRISEALAITAAAVDLDAGTVSLETLKKRTRGVVRQIPLPSSVLRELDRVFDLRTRQHNPELATRRLWTCCRSTGWRQVKNVMKIARIFGGAAMPKGLRHAFGVAAFAVVPPHLVQRWLGHSSLRTTAIYGEVSGQEERAFAARMWKVR
jgi:integrase